MTFAGNEALQALSFNETSDIFPRIRRKRFVWLHVSYYLGPLSSRFIAEPDTRRCIENRVAITMITLWASCKVLELVGGDGMCNSFRYASNHSLPVFWREEILEILYSVDGRIQRCNCWRNPWDCGEICGKNNNFFEFW